MSAEASTPSSVARERRREVAARHAAQVDRLRQLAEEYPKEARLTSTELASLMGWEPVTTRSAMRRLGVDKHGRSDDGENLYPARWALLALASRPGQGRGPRRSR